MVVWQQTASSAPDLSQDSAEIPAETSLGQDKTTLDLSDELIN
jgi:hypothetical protein